MHSTYAFEDFYLTIVHPAMGQLSIQGTGVGSVTYAQANDVSSHDLAADGSVMTSKIKAGNGTIAISVQQTSDAHAWLTRLYNYLVAAPSKEWAQISSMGVSTTMRTTHVGRNMSFQKRADKPYQQQGQQVTWTFMAAALEER